MKYVTPPAPAKLPKRANLHCNCRHPLKRLGISARRYEKLAKPWRNSQGTLQKSRGNFWKHFRHVIETCSAPSRITKVSPIKTLVETFFKKGPTLIVLPLQVPPSATGDLEEVCSPCLDESHLESHPTGIVFRRWLYPSFGSYG